MAYLSYLYDDLTAHCSVRFADALDELFFIWSEEFTVSEFLVFSVWLEKDLSLDKDHTAYTLYALCMENTGETCGHR